MFGLCMECVELVSVCMERMQFVSIHGICIECMQWGNVCMEFICVACSCVECM